MSRGENVSWQAVQDEVLNRIRSRFWKPGELIPNEAKLAAEFGCARATVNRALRAVAETGLLDRRRKAGTRVVKHPVRKATLAIPIIRHQIEDRGQAYGYGLIDVARKKAPLDVRARMKLAASCENLHVKALHYADNKPFVYEERWINVAAVPEILSADLDRQSANEWLVRNAPFTRGDIAFSAVKADRAMADTLQIGLGDALFVTERETWNDDLAVTMARLVFATGYRMQTSL